MSTINAKILDQKLMITAAPIISSGNKDVDFIEFDFDSSWDEFPERYCVFYLTADDPYQVTIENGRCGIVQAMTEQEGVFCFGVWGRTLNGDKIKTSTDVEYRVARGVPTEQGDSQEIINLIGEIEKLIDECGVIEYDASF